MPSLTPAAHRISGLPAITRVALLLLAFTSPALARHISVRTTAARSTAAAPSRYPGLMGGSGELLAGKIAGARQVTVPYRNTGDATVRVTVPTGLIFIATQDPHSHEAVVVIDGCSLDVAPSSIGTAVFYTINVGRTGAAPVDGAPLRALGPLPEDALELLLEYRDTRAEPAAALQAAREKAITAINDAVDVALR